MKQQATQAPPQEYWPFDVSHQPSLKIGEVREVLSNEFPLLSVSKIRHYETIELISPYRTPSNQRMFSQADVERLRFILTEQRDRYLPLSQIAELLNQLDNGQAGIEHPGRMRVVTTDVARPRPGTRLTKSEVADLTGASIELIEQLAKLSVVEVDPRGRLTSHAVDIVRYGQLLLEQGLDLRLLRTIKNSAHSHAALMNAVLAPHFARQAPLARERAFAEGAEMTASAVKLYQALLVENLELGIS